MRDRGPEIGAMAALAAAIPFSHLLNAGYGVLSAEVLILTVGLAAAGAGIASVIGGAPVLRNLVVAALLYVYADTYFIGPGQMPVAMAAAFILLVLAVLQITRRQLLPVIAVFAAVFSAVTIFQPAGSRVTVAGGGAPVREGPAPEGSILHIILDEMMTPAAPAHAPLPDHPAAALLDDLAARGFEVHALAETIAPETMLSLSAIANFSTDTDNVIVNAPGAAITNGIRDNRYIRGLVAQGYDVSVLQTSFLELCGGLEAVRCTTYPRYGDMGDFAGEPLATRLKVAALALHQNFISETTPNVALYRDAAYGLARATGRRTPSYSAFGLPMTAKALMERLPETVRAIRPGEAHLLHLLLPHFPYMLDEACALLPIGAWGYPIRYSDVGAEEDLHAAFWDQTACTMALLAPILDAAADNPFLTVILHGDHGARVTWFSDTPDDHDLHATLLAVREPGRAPRIRTEPVVLQDILPGVLRPYAEP